MRRANGSGSVYKMTHKPLRKPYRAVITIGEDEEGRMIRKTVGTFRTAREALEFLKNYKGDPKVFEKQDVTFGTCFKSRQGTSRYYRINVSQLRLSGTTAGRIDGYAYRRCETNPSATNCR